MKNNSEPESTFSMFLRTFFRIFFCILACACVVAAVIVGVLYGLSYALIPAGGALIFAILMILAKESAEKKAPPKADFMNTEEENERIRERESKK